MRLIDLLRRCGLARPSLALSVHYQQAPTFWFDAAVHETDPANAEAGDQARLLVDLSGNGHHAVQNTDAKQGTVGADADGNAEIAVDGTADCYGLAEGAGWPAGTSHSFWFDIDADDATGSHDYLIDFQTGRLVLYSHTNVGQVAAYTSGLLNLGSATTGEQSLEFHLDFATTTASAYRNGVHIGSAAYPVTCSMGGATSLGGYYDQSTNFFDGAFQAAWGRDSLQTTTEIFESRAARAAKFPTRWADTLPLVVPHGVTGIWLDAADDSTVATAGGDVTTWADKCGCGNDATAGTAPTHDQANDLVNAAAASSQYLDLGTAPNATGCTFDVWVRVTDLLAAYSLWGSIDGSSNACYVQVQTNGKVRAVAGTGGGNATFDSTATLTAGVWSHVTVTFTTTGIIITIDGTAASSGAFTETLSTADCYLYAHNNNGTDANHANCDISDFHQLPHAATAAEIAYLYSLGRNP